MLDIDQFRVKIKQLTSKIKTLFIHQSFPIAKTDFTSLFLDVEHIIHEVYGYFMSMTSIDDAMKTLPETGQLLSELSRIPMMQMCPQLFTAWMKCVVWFYRSDAVSPIEVKARDWALKLLHCMVSHQVKSDDPALRNLGMVPSVLLKKQLCHNVSQMINLLEMRNGHLCDLDKDCNKPTACENISILKSLSSVLLTIHPEEEFAALWHTVLQQLSQCLVDDDILNIYRRLTLSQAGGYRGESKMNLPCNALVVLWASHLPALEQEVLEMVMAVSMSLGLSSITRKIIQSRNLAQACSENYQIAHGVHQMLNSLLIKTGGAGTMSDIVTQFYQCVREGEEQNSMKPKVCVSHSSFYKPELQPLVSVLSYSADKNISHEMRQISYAIFRVLRSTNVTSQTRNSLTMLVLEFKHWIYKAMWNVLQCDRKNVDSCLNVIYLSSFYNPALDVTKTSVREMVHCLRGLVGKTNLKLADIEYSISSAMKPNQDNSTAQQILVVFLFQSVTGLHLAEDILRLATCNNNPEDHMYVLLYAHQIFNINMDMWSPYKTSQYIQLLKTFRERLASQSERKGESETKSALNHKEILTELDKLLCTPVLCR